MNTRWNFLSIPFNYYLASFRKIYYILIFFFLFAHYNLSEKELGGW